MHKVLFCPPTYFEVRDVKNPFMQPGNPVDRQRAEQQWHALRQAFQDAGFQLESIPAVPDLEDMVFAANQTFVGRSPRIGPFIVPGHMRHESRRREVQHFVDWFRERGYQVLELALDDDYLEGHGDLLWEVDFSRIWAGFGFRSSRRGVEKFADKMRDLGLDVVSLELADPTFYHLDTCFAPLAPGGVLIYPGAFTAPALATIHEQCARVYEVSRDEALKFVCNGVAANGKFLTPRLSGRLAEALAREGLEPVIVDTSEFEKSGGSVACLKLFME
jgi:N-dimethylarginine dimethylaminohydrolase